MGLLLYVVFGALVGWVASIIMKTDGQQGIVLNIVVGIVGAFIGSWLAGQLGEPGVRGTFDLYSFIVALIGAIVLLAGVQLVRMARNRM